MKRRDERLALVLRGSIAAASAGAIVLAVLLGIGLAQGYRPVVITTGSMTPSAPPGALIVARPSSDYAVGDILVMRREGRATITHRVVEIEDNGDGGRYAITRGDANAEIDVAPYPLGQSELVGRWVIPDVGRVLLRFQSPMLALGTVVLAVAVLSFGILRRIWHRSDEPLSGEPVATQNDPRRRRTAAHRRIGAATAIGVLFGTTGVAWSLYLGVDGVGNNLFSASACYDARLGSVQSGQLLNTTDGTQTVSIAAVDPQASFLVFSVRSASNEPSDSTVMGELTAGTTIEFTRQTDAGVPPPIMIEWSVVEYDCGVSVQRGSSSGNGTNQLDLPIEPVDPSTSFVLGSSVPVATATDADTDDLQVFELVGEDTVEIRSDAGAPTPLLQQYAWQVVTFTAPGDAAVQTVSASLGSGSGSTTITLPSPVDPATTFLLASVTSPSVGPDIGERLVRVALVDSSTIEVSRLVSTDSIDIAVQVIELRDGSTVQRGVLNLAPTELSGTARLAPVDLDRSVALSTVMVPGSASGGSTDHVTDDVLGEASGAMTLIDATTVSVERDSAASLASFTWQVITWGGPSWADPLSPFRQRIDITAGTVDAPDGYTAPLALDHGSLVASGLSLPSGDDIRVWRHDGVSWTELDRVLDDDSAWNAADTTLWFRTQESISANETVSYWLYFGNASPPPVLDDPANVWLLVEGFEGGTLGQFEDRTGGTGWYRADPWTRRLELTIDATAVSSDLSGQQVLVRVSDPDLAANAQPDGSDFRFTLADGITPLQHEIEEWSGGSLTAWVTIPTISSSTDTTIHLYYGAPDAPDQSRPRAVWSGEIASWHLARDPFGQAPTLDDVGPNQLDGLALGDPVLVVTTSGPAADLDGTTDRFEAAPLAVAAQPFTVSTWFSADTFGSDPVLVAQGDPTLAGVFELAIDTSVAPTGRFRIRTGGTSKEVLGGTITAGTWHHLAATWDGSNAVLYLDGAAVGSTSATGSTVSGASTPIVLGGDAAGTRTLDGRLGEVQIGSSVWSADRVGFVEANLRSPATVVTASAPTSGVWFDQGDWTIRRPLAIDSAQIAGPLNDFPLLVQLADADLGLNAQPDGDDLIFVAADGVTRLDHQIESWNSGTGILSAWVRIPVIDSNTDTQLFVYLANPTAADQSDPIGVWGPDADLVLIGN